MKNFDYCRKQKELKIIHIVKFFFHFFKTRTRIIGSFNDTRFPAQQVSFYHQNCIENERLKKIFASGIDVP